MSDVSSPGRDGNTLSSKFKNYNRGSRFSNRSDLET